MKVSEHDRVPRLKVRHLHLSGLWLDVDLETDTQTTCLKEIGLHARHFLNHLRLNNQHIFFLGNTLIEKRILTLINR